MTEVSHNGSTQTQVPVQPLAVPAKSKGTNTFLIVIIIIAVILLFCCAGVFATVLIGNYSSNNSSNNNSNVTATPTDTPKDDRNYVNGADKPPISRSYSAEVKEKTRLLGTKDGYTANINALGDPSYTFSILYKSNWKATKFTKEDYILTADDGYESIGVLYFAKGTKAYQLSCYQLVSDIFSDSKWDGKDAGNVSIHDDTWNRITYTVDKGTNNEVRGVDQCLKREDALILYFFVATADKWNQNSTEYDKLVNDIYVSKTSLEY